MFTRPNLILRAEGGAVFGASLFFYHEIQAGWILFAALILAPDLFMTGYLVNARLGAAVYNLAHTLVMPLLLIAFSIFSRHAGLLPYGLIWTAHIGMDRMLGFGLKYATQFRDTHLQRV